MRKHLTKRVSLIVVITTLIFFCSQILFFAVFLPKIYDSNTQSIKFQIVEFDKEYAESLCESLFDDTIGDEHLLAMEIQSKNDQGDALVTQDQDFLKTNNNSYCTGKLVAYKQSGFHFYDDDDQNGLGKFWYLTIRLNDKQSLLFSANKDQFVETLVLIIGEVIFAILLSLLVAFLLVSRFSKKFVQPFNEVRYDEDDRLDASQITTRYPEMLKFFEHISNQAKLRRQFTANVSHEFKTPLAVLAAKNDTARRAFEKGDTVKILKSFEETERLLKETSKVIDLLLELGKIDEGDYHLNITEFNIKDTIGSILKHSAEKASGNASSFATRIDQLNNITITSDRMLVREIINALLSNALKYYDREINFWAQERGDRVVISIHNDGEPIPPKDLPHIFERFYRVDKSRNRKTGGFGIGLSLVKHMTALLQGSVKAESNAKSGTTFTLELPRVLA